MRYSKQMRILLGLRIPCPEPIGLPAGMTLVAPAFFQSPGGHRIVARVAQHLKTLRPRVARSLATWRSGRAVASSRRPALPASPNPRRDSPGSTESRVPAAPTRTASSAVKQPAVLGSSVYRLVSMYSRMFWPAALTNRSRRTATVMQSVPERPAPPTSAYVAYLPVPDDQPAGQRVGADLQSIVASNLLVHHQCSLCDSV